MLCLHGEEAGTSTTEKGTFWYCKQDDSPCHFICSEDEMELYDKAVKKFLATNQKRPKCCGVAPEASKIGLVMSRKTPYFGQREPSPVRNYAKMKVVTDREKESYGRSYFVCSKRKERCNYFAWGDEYIVKRPLCKHGKPCEFHTVKKEGPNYYRSFFCCPRPKNENCKYSVWLDALVGHCPSRRTGYYTPK